MNIEKITSLQNPLVKKVLSLQKTPYRREQKLFAIEGEQELCRAIEGGIQIDTLMFCPELMVNNSVIRNVDSIKKEWGDQIKGIPVIAITALIFNRLAYRDQVGGLIALGRYPQCSEQDLELGETPLVLVVEGVEKPGNLGALLRTADAAGVDGVIVCDPELDLYNPNVIRSSLGGIFMVPIIVLSFEDALARLEAKGIQAVLTSPDAERLYTEVDYTGPSAIVLGSEKAGLPQSALEDSLTTVRIPMQGRIDSINLSVSGGIMLYEVLRQRRIR